MLNLSDFNRFKTTAFTGSFILTDKNEAVNYIHFALSIDRTFYTVSVNENLTEVVRFKVPVRASFFQVMEAVRNLYAIARSVA